jgi:protein gp37
VSNPYDRVWKVTDATLTDPLRWRKPSMVRVVWPEAFDDFEQTDRLYAVITLCPQHTFQLLPDRPERMAEYLVPMDLYRLGRAALNTGLWKGPTKGWQYANSAKGRVWFPPWPLSNVWLGTSVENQQAADERIPHLLRCPAAVRFLSCEPLLGEVDIFAPIRDMKDRDTDFDPGGDGRYLHWVIVGGESGPDARPCNVDWIKSIVRQCKAAGVPCFVKQLGSNQHIGSEYFNRPKDRKGSDPAEWPEGLRVREMPEVRP